MVQKLSSLQEESENKIHIFGKNIEVTGPLRDHIVAKMKKIEELTPPVVGIHVYLEVQREEHRVEIEYKFSHFRIVINHAVVQKAHVKMDDIYHAIDIACDKLRGKIRRWKTRIQDHHGKKPFEIEERVVRVLNRSTADLDRINDQIEEETTKKFEEEFGLPQVVKHKKRQLPMLTMEEATMRIDLSGDHFLVYRGQEDQKLKVMYVRRDKTLGILEVE